jgi:hypothetical protein
MQADVEPVPDGLVTFFSSHYALRAESALRAVPIQCMLVPGPKELSPNCGVALRFPLAEKGRVIEVFASRKVKYENIFAYIFTPRG